MGALMDPAAWTDESLGETTGCIEVKLVDYADAGYFSSNKPPQGEVWIRGGSVTEGYLDLEKENKESFTEDGWFKTGDIGEFDWRGDLKIIDRKKNLVKTLNGEYIALEKVCQSLDVLSYGQLLMQSYSSNPYTAQPPLSATSVSTPQKTKPNPSPSSSLSKKPCSRSLRRMASRATDWKSCARMTRFKPLSSRRCRALASKAAWLVRRLSREWCLLMRSGRHRM